MTATSRRSLDRLPERPFRFGVGLKTPRSRKDFVDKCREAEDLGYDVIAVADHLGLLAPFPALTLAAEVTTRPRLATSVLNAAFYNPALLARDVACTDQFTDGRVELGLGAGYVAAEFAAAGLRWPTPRERVDHLERTISELRRFYVEPVYGLPPARPAGPPLWLAGRGNRMLRFAAREADIIGFSGFSSPSEDGLMGQLDNRDKITERVELTCSALGDRISHVEFNILVQYVLVTNDRRKVAEELESKLLLTANEMLEVPTVLIGTIEQIAEQLIEYRENLGFSYITVAEKKMAALAPVIERLR